jgi:hypothetical protein
MSKTARGVGLLLGVVALAAALAPAAPQAADPNKALAASQLNLARDALQDLDRLWRLGEMSLSDPRFPLWWRREVDAVRASGAGKAEVVAALELYVKRMKDMSKLVESAHQKAHATHVDVLDAQYRAAEAEMWLNQEKER